MKTNEPRMLVHSALAAAAQRFNKSFADGGVRLGWLWSVYLVRGP